MRHWVIAVALVGCGGGSRSTTSSAPVAPSGPSREAAAQAEIAARNAEEGQRLFAAGQYEQASRQYMDAVARVPAARYFYLLCQSKYHEGKFSEALTSCDGAERTHPNAALAVKIRELRTLITSEAQKQGIKR